jgi:hypothetical protein
VSALCENGDALAHAHQDELGKDENKFTKHFKAVIPEGYICVGKFHQSGGLPVDDWS